MKVSKSGRKNEEQTRRKYTHSNKIAAAEPSKAAKRSKDNVCAQKRVYIVRTGRHNPATDEKEKFTILGPPTKPNDSLPSSVHMPLWGPVLRFRVWIVWQAAEGRVDADHDEVPPVRMNDMECL